MIFSVHMSNFNNCDIAEHFQVNKLDKCPVACESVDFSAQLSYARYPANTYADLLAKKRNMTGTVYENRQHLRYQVADKERGVLSAGLPCLPTR